jgi:hypothetical protein
MSDNVIPFDKYHYLKKRLPGYGTPAFGNSYAEARAFPHVAEGRFLSCAQLTHLASKLEPLALRILRDMVRKLHRARGRANLQT